MAAEITPHDVTRGARTAFATGRSHRRAVLAKPAKPDPGLLYPPYSSRAMKVISKLL